MEWRPLGIPGGRQPHRPRPQAAGTHPLANRRIVMLRIALSLTLAVAVHIFCPASALGQENGEAAYDARALRFESHWGRVRIVRGADGPVVGTAGVLRTVNVEQLVAGSPRAETEARLFKGSHRRGAIATTIGALTFAAGLIATTNSSNNAATPILMIGGLGSMFWGARRFGDSHASLSRAIWWYNRDLKARD